MIGNIIGILFRCRWNETADMNEKQKGYPDFMNSLYFVINNQPEIFSFSLSARPVSSDSFA